jgi:hypothetical protein
VTGRCSTVPQSAARPLDARPARHHNVVVRLRLVFVAIALAVLALAGLRLENQRSVAPHSSIGASSHLSSQPAPDPEPPIIVRAAVTASATAQMHLACEPRCYVRPAQDVPSGSRQPPREPAYRAGLPRSFPLLI